MTHLPLRRLGPVFDFSQQRRFDPDAAMRYLFGVGLRFADQRLEPRLQVLGGCGVKAVVDLACIYQVVAFAPPEI
jgi:hypothetical protein